MTALSIAFAAAAVYYFRSPGAAPRDSLPNEGGPALEARPVSESGMAIGVREPSRVGIQYTSADDQAIAKSSLRAGLYDRTIAEPGVDPRVSTTPLAQTTSEPNMATLVRARFNNVD